VQAEPEQVVGLVGVVGVVDEVLYLVEDVSVQESEEQPVGVQCVGGAEPGADEQFEEVFQGRKVAGGRRPRGLLSGRVTSSGTALG
jgi:hypothetical protein